MAPEPKRTRDSVSKPGRVRSVPRWRLDSDRCAVIEVRLMVGEDATTSRECVRDDGYYELRIDASAPISAPNVWLTPYAPG
jgi:hypothetical protein